MRLGRIVFVVGVVLIASALMFVMNPLTDSVVLYDDVSSGFIFSANSDIRVEVIPDGNVGSGVFSILLWLPHLRNLRTLHHSMIRSRYLGLAFMLSTSLLQKVKYCIYTSTYIHFTQIFVCSAEEL